MSWILLAAISALWIGCGDDTGTEDSSGTSDPTDTTTDTTDSAILIDDAAIEELTFPATLVCGAEAQGLVKVQNTGTTTWTRDDGYKLAAVDDNDPFRQPDPKVWLPVSASVVPGDVWDFEVALVAPLEEGDYTSDWRMLREGVDWFGETAGASITVSCDPPAGR